MGTLCTGKKAPIYESDTRHRNTTQSYVGAPSSAARGRAAPRLWRRRPGPLRLCTSRPSPTTSTSAAYLMQASGQTNGYGRPKNLKHTDAAQSACPLTARCLLQLPTATLSVTDANECTPKLKRTQTDAPPSQNGRTRTGAQVKTDASIRYGRSDAARTPAPRMVTCGLSRVWCWLAGRHYNRQHMQATRWKEKLVKSRKTAFHLSLWLPQPGECTDAISWAPDTGLGRLPLCPTTQLQCHL